MSYAVFVPSLPPVGINATYGVGKASVVNNKLKSGRIYKEKDLIEWNEKAIMIIRNKAINQGWTLSAQEYWALEIIWWGRKNDSDSFSKNLMDVVAYALEFNDAKILSYKSEKLLEAPDYIYVSEGFIARLLPYTPRKRDFHELLSGPV